MVFLEAVAVGVKTRGRWVFHGTANMLVFHPKIGNYLKKNSVNIVLPRAVELKEPGCVLRLAGCRTSSICLSFGASPVSFPFIQLFSLIKS